MTAVQDTAEESLWSRPSGIREVLIIALPMVASMLSWTLMNFIDAMFVMRYVSPAAMSAQFSASITWFLALSLFWGMCSYASTFVSQYFGDGQPAKIGPAVWQGVWLAAFFTPIALLAIPLTPFIFGSIHDAETARLETQFFQILCVAAPGMLAAQALEGFFSGRGKTNWVMLVDAIAVLVNLVLAWLWVVGVGGPSFGLAGAAWATVCAQWSRALMYTALMLGRENQRQFNTLHGARLDFDLLRRLIRFGGPSGVQMLLDVGGFTVFVLLVARVGDVEREASSLVFRISQVAFMPVWGFGLATVVLVGQRLGEDRPDLAARAARTTYALALSYMGAISLLFVSAPSTFLRAFGVDDPQLAAEAESVIALAARLMWFVAAYNLCDATYIILSSVLRGAGDTQFIMRVSLVSAAAVIAAIALAVEAFDAQIYACWWILTIWIWSLALIYFIRYRRGKWQSMRVIDQTHHGAAHAPAAHAPAAQAPSSLDESDLPRGDLATAGAIE